MPSSLLVDLGPALGAHGQRGIGRYVRGLRETISSLPDDLRSRVCSLSSVFDPDINVRGIRLTQLGRNGVSGWIGGRLVMRLAIRNTGASVIHATNPQRPSTPAIASLVTVYDLIPLRDPETLRSWRLDHRVIYRSYLRQIKRAARIIAISNATANDLEEKLGISRDLIDVIYPVVAAPENFHREVHSDPTFLFVGALDPHKRPELALRAFAAFRARNNAGRLRYVGPADKDQARGLRHLAIRLGINESIAFEGRVSDMELEQAYAEATALISTSTVEGFGLPAVEALLRGVPVIIAATAAAEETLGSAAAIVPADVDAIASAMAHPRQASVEAVSEIRDKFALGAAARSLEATYRCMLD